MSETEFYSKSHINHSHTKIPKRRMSDGTDYAGYFYKIWEGRRGS